MKSIKLMFSMLLIGMISFTSCDSEVGQITESSTISRVEDDFPRELEYNVFEDLNSQVVYDAYENTIGRYASVKPVIKCMSTQTIEDSYGVAHPLITACILNNGVSYYVEYEPAYMTVGNTYVIASSSSSVGCNCR